MEAGMYSIAKVEDEKIKLTQKLSEQYAQDIINIGEYERILEYINKLETLKELNIIENIIQENDNGEPPAVENNVIPKANEKYLSIFSWRTTTLKSINGNGGKYISVFGTNRIIIDELPKGRTIINVNTIFGLTEIIVPQGVKIVNKAAPIFSGVFILNNTHKENKEAPELYITGKAVFGNITIKTTDELEKQLKEEKEFEEKVKEKVMQRMYDKYTG
jgi:hypothetical protein